MSVIERSVSARTVIFLHIPKTGGTTLKSVIERQYPREEVFSIMPWVGPHSGTEEDFAQLPRSRRASVGALTGHMAYGVHEIIPGPSTYFTFLREPTARVLSHYAHARRDPKHSLFPYVQEMSLKDALINERHVAQVFDNFQTRVISGVWHSVPFGACSSEMLATAKENLRRHFSVVGVVERFDESLLLLQEVFGWRFVYYSRQNVARRARRPALADEETMALIRRHNRLDEALYDFACRLCAEQIEAAGEPLQQRLKRFQRMNGFASLGMRLFGWARTVSVRAALKKVTDR